jgi:chromosome segregation ATPase
MQRQQTRREREVWMACDHLLKEGASLREINGQNIRECLVDLGYKKGSNTEIYRYLKSWSQARSIDLKAPEPPLIKPESLPDPLIQVVQQVRRALLEEADGQILCVKEEAAQQITHMKEELGISQQELAAVQQALVVKSEEYQRLQADSEKICTINCQLEQDNAHWKAETTRLAQLAEERLRNGEQALKDLKETHTTEIDRLTQQLTATMVRYDQALSEQKASMEAQRHQWIAEKDQFQTALHKLEKQLQKAELSEQTSREHNKVLFDQLEKVNQMFVKVENENQQLIQAKMQLEGIVNLRQYETDNLKKGLEEQKNACQHEHHQLLKAIERIGQLSEMLHVSQTNLVKAPCDLEKA